MKIPRSRNTQSVLDWRKEVYERDGYKCVRCGSEKRIVAHHIIPWEENKELRIDIANGETLCHACHIVHHKKGVSRTTWMKGKRHTEKAKQIISIKAKLRKRKPHSEETKAKQRANAGRPKGIPMSDKQKMQLSIFNKGKKLSSEHIAAIRDHGGRKKGPKTAYEKERRRLFYSEREFKYDKSTKKGKWVLKQKQ